MKEKIYLKDGHYLNLQDAINKVENNSILVLENKVYSESLVIDKNIQIEGQDATTLLVDKEIKIDGGQVTLHHLTIDVQGLSNDIGVMVSEGQLTCVDCVIKTVKQKKDTFSCFWVETGALALEDCQIHMMSNFIKIINGEGLVLVNNQMSLMAGNIAIESHGMAHVKIFNNKIRSAVALMRSSKIFDMVVEENHIESSMPSGSLMTFDSLEHGNEFSIKNNNLQISDDTLITISNSLSVKRDIQVTGNKINQESQSQIDLSHLQGRVLVEDNNFRYLKASQCHDVMIKNNQLQGVNCHQISKLIIHNNQVHGVIQLHTVNHAQLKKNTLVNERRDTDAIKIAVVNKLIFEHNKISSVDHGLTLLNAGDNLETKVHKNEFISCRKRAVNLSSTMQKKHIKTEVSINSNIFMRNDKAIHLDDRNLKSLLMEENYFGENHDALSIFGGKATGEVKLVGNYFDPSGQKLEIRSAEVCQLNHNMLNDSKLSIRGCDDIIITGNHIDNQYYNKGKSLYNEISIKTGGLLTISQNVMLKGKLRHEKKEVYDQLNISSYERNPSINISGNFLINENYGFFDKPRTALKLFPDESLLSVLSYQIQSKEHGELKELDIDDMMKADFIKLRDNLLAIKEGVSNPKIKEVIGQVVESFNIDIFNGRDSNDIYRFIVKSNETVEMLKIYASMEEDTDLKTSERIVGVMDNYMIMLNSFLSKQTEDEQDKLNAQLKLLENLL